MAWVPEAWSTAKQKAVPSPTAIHKATTPTNISKQERQGPEMALPTQISSPFAPLYERIPGSQGSHPVCADTGYRTRV